MRAKFLPGEMNQFLSDALLLMVFVHRQVGEIAAKMEVGHRPRNPDEGFTLPAGNDEIGILQHSREARRIVNGTSLSQGRTDKNIPELLGSDGS